MILPPLCFTLKIIWSWSFCVAYVSKKVRTPPSTFCCVPHLVSQYSHEPLYLSEINGRIGHYILCLLKYRFHVCFFRFLSTWNLPALWDPKMAYMWKSHRETEEEEKKPPHQIIRNTSVILLHVRNVTNDEQLNNRKVQCQEVETIYSYCLRYCFLISIKLFTLLLKVC